MCPSLIQIGSKTAEKTLHKQTNKQTHRQTDRHYENNGHLAVKQSIWAPSTLSDIDSLESVQRRFTKRLSGLHSFSYEARWKRLNLQSLELRRLLTDLMWCYKIIFGLVDIDVNQFFTLSSVPQTRGHRYSF